MFYFLLLITFLPIILFGIYIYNKDTHKEPKKLLLKLFFGGILAVFTTLSLTKILGLIFPFFNSNTNTLNKTDLIIYIFIGIALIEEISKFIWTYALAYDDSEFDESFDGIVYAVFVALGFAFLENIMYVLLNNNIISAYQTGILRAFSAIPSHICNAIIMGYYISISKKNNDKFYLIYAVLIPTIMHGIYDYCLFCNSSTFYFIWLIFCIVMFIYVFKKLNIFSKNNESFRS